MSNPNSTHPLQRATEVFLAGIDGGGSKTECWVGRSVDRESPEVLGHRHCGPTNPHSVGFAEAARRINELLNTCQSELLPAGSAFSAECLCLAGAGRSCDQQNLLTHLRQHRETSHLIFTHDGLAVLRAVIPSGPGAALIAGTGSLAYGVAADGRECRAGGGGPLASDEGSGHWLACQALQAALKADDGRGPATSLLSLLCQELGVADADELIGKINAPELKRPQIAALARTVVAADESGDEVATRLLAASAAELAQLAAAVVRRLGTLPTPLEIACGGGLLAHSPRIRQLLKQQLEALFSPPVSLRLVPHPAHGALQIAQLQLANGGSPPAGMQPPGE